MSEARDRKESEEKIKEDPDYKNEMTKLCGKLKKYCKQGSFVRQSSVTMRGDQRQQRLDSLAAQVDALQEGKISFQDFDSMVVRNVNLYHEDLRKKIALDDKKSLKVKFFLTGTSFEEVPENLANQVTDKKVSEKYSEFVKAEKGHTFPKTLNLLRNELDDTRTKLNEIRKKYNLPPFERQETHIAKAQGMEQKDIKGAAEKVDSAVERKGLGKH